jgi:hypothetical protein
MAASAHVAPSVTATCAAAFQRSRMYSGVLHAIQPIIPDSAAIARVRKPLSARVSPSQSSAGRKWITTSFLWNRVRRARVSGHRKRSGEAAASAWTVVPDLKVRATVSL